MICRIKFYTEYSRVLSLEWRRGSFYFAQNRECVAEQSKACWEKSHGSMKSEGEECAYAKSTAKDEADT